MFKPFTALLLAVMCFALIASTTSLRTVAADEDDDDSTTGSFSSETLGTVDITVDAAGKFKITWKRPTGKSETRSFSSVAQFKKNWPELAKYFVKLEIKPGSLMAEMKEESESTEFTPEKRSSSSSSSSSSNSSKSSNPQGAPHALQGHNAVIVEEGGTHVFVVFDGDKIYVVRDTEDPAHTFTTYNSCAEFVDKAPQLAAKVLKKLMAEEEAEKKKASDNKR